MSWQCCLILKQEPKYGAGSDVSRVQDTSAQSNNPERGAVFTLLSASCYSSTRASESGTKEETGGWRQECKNRTEKQLQQSSACTVVAFHPFFDKPGKKAGVG